MLRVVPITTCLRVVVVAAVLRVVVVVGVVRGCADTCGPAPAGAGCADRADWYVRSERTDYVSPRGRKRESRGGPHNLHDPEDRYARYSGRSGEG